MCVQFQQMTTDPIEPPLPPELKPSLGGRYYTDPGQFTRDQDAVFARSWLCVARSEDVADQGARLGTTAAGRDVIVVRGRDGRLRGYHHLARHRGAALGVVEWLGYVWVNLDLGAAPLADQMEPQILERLEDLATFARYDIGALRVGHRIEYDVASNWKSVVENFMECYHCATIHPELTAALPTFATGWGTVNSGRAAGAAFAEEKAGFSLSGRAVRPRLPGLMDSDDRLFYGVVLRPNAFLNLTPDHVAFFRMEPLSRGRTRVVVDWLFEATETERPDFDPSDSVQILDVTNRQDFEACERAYVGMASPLYRGVLVPSEHVIVGFHDYYLRMLGERPTTARVPPLRDTPRVSPSGTFAP